MQTMPNWLKKRAFLTPDRPAIIFNGQPTTFAKVYEKADDVAGKLTFNGVKKGHFTALLLRNHLDSAVILLALQLLGVRAVILNNRLTADEMVWQLKDSKAVFLISEELFQQKTEEIKSSLRDLPLLLKEGLNDTPFNEPHILEELDLDEICTIMYTSGTTGHPKGVIQTYGNHWWSATGSALNLGLHENDCWLCTVPLFHISGYSILMKSIIYGMKIVLHEGFNKKLVIDDIQKERVTISPWLVLHLLEFSNNYKEISFLSISDVCSSGEVRQHFHS